MNMKADLYEMLKECLIIPYPKEVVERMEKLTLDYANQNHVDDNWVTRWTIFLFCKQPNAELKQYMEAQYEELYGERLLFPTSTVNALMAYMICQAICGKYENADSEFCSIALMNCVILLNGKIGTMPFAEYLLDGYGKLQNYMCKATEAFDVDTVEFVDQLFDMSVDEFNDVNSEEKLAICKKLAIDAWKYNIIKMLEVHKDSYCSYAECFHVLMSVVNSMPYCYLHIDIEQLLKYLCNPEDKVTTISAIVNELVQEGCVFDAPECDSSILLRLTKEDEMLTSLSFMNTEISKHDFCVYLYYELIMEKIAEHDGE